jgi:hypothetical protein
MAAIGISIKDIMHERAWIQSDIFSVEVSEYTRVCFCLSATSQKSLILSKSTIMINVNFTLEQAMKAQRGSRGIAVLFP